MRQSSLPCSARMTWIFGWRSPYWPVSSASRRSSSALSAIRLSSSAELPSSPSEAERLPLSTCCRSRPRVAALPARSTTAATSWALRPAISAAIGAEASRHASASPSARNPASAASACRAGALSACSWPLNQPLCAARGCVLAGKLAGHVALGQPVGDARRLLGIARSIDHRDHVALALALDRQPLEEPADYVARRPWAGRDRSREACWQDLVEKTGAGARQLSVTVRGRAARSPREPASARPGSAPGCRPMRCPGFGLEWPPWPRCARHRRARSRAVPAPRRPA